MKWLLSFCFAGFFKVFHVKTCLEMLRFFRPRISCFFDKRHQQYFAGNKIIILLAVKTCFLKNFSRQKPLPSYHF